MTSYPDRYDPDQVWDPEDGFVDRDYLYDILNEDMSDDFCPDDWVYENYDMDDMWDNVRNGWTYDDFIEQANDRFGDIVHDALDEAFNDIDENDESIEVCGNKMYRLRYEEEYL